MAGRLLTDELWNEIEPLFPTHQPSGKGGRPPVDNRTVFTCVLFMLKTGIGWRDLPTELGASEKTVRRRLNDWKELGLWNAIHQQMLAKLRAAGRLDLAEVLIDGGLIKAPCGGENAAPTPPTVAGAAAN
jgi:transposase